MHSKSLTLGIVIGAVLFTGFSVVLAWTGPTSAPPNGNTDAPINVGTTDQVKNAGLGINSLAVFGNAILSGTSRYLNFGTTAGSGGYGLRDNAGIMEIRDSNGAWARFATTSAAGAFQQISFSDGTTQTTAASAGGATQQTTTSCTSSGSTGILTCTTSCSTGYVRSGCSGGDTSSGAARADIMSIAPSGTAACVCRFRANSGSFGGIPAGTCYAYCVH